MTTGRVPTRCALGTRGPALARGRPLLWSRGEQGGQDPEGVGEKVLCPRRAHPLVFIILIYTAAARQQTLLYVLYIARLGAVDTPLCV